MRVAMDEYLFQKDEGRFARMISLEKYGSIAVDKTVDASLFGVFAFGAYDPNDEKVKATMQQVHDTLWCKTGVGGLTRYEGDLFYKTPLQKGSNPWFITTLWLAHYYIASANSQNNGLGRGLELLQWVTDHALPSGVLAEQVNPDTGEPLSVSPLTWSHATFVYVVQMYLEKLISSNICDVCGQPKLSKTAVSSF